MDSQGFGKTPWDWHCYSNLNSSRHTYNSGGRPRATRSTAKRESKIRGMIALLTHKIVSILHEPQDDLEMELLLILTPL